MKTEFGLVFDQALKKRQGLQTLMLDRLNRLAARLYPVPEGTYRAVARTSKWPPPVQGQPSWLPEPDTLLRVSADTLEIVRQGKPVWRGRFERQPFGVRSEPNSVRVADDGTSNLCGNQQPSEWTQTWRWLSQTRFFFAYDAGYGMRVGPLCPARDGILSAEFELVQTR